METQETVCAMTFVSPSLWKLRHKMKGVSRSLPAPRIASPRKTFNKTGYHTGWGKHSQNKQHPLKCKIHNLPITYSQIIIKNTGS